MKQRNNHDRKSAMIEMWAKEILMRAYPDTFHEVVRSDRPDLVCNNSTVGIEITQVMYPNEGIVGAFVSKNANKSEDEIGKEKLDRMKGYGYEPFMYNNKLGGYMPHEGIWINCGIFLSAFRDKLAKMTEYKVYPEMGLFMFAPIGGLYDIDDFIEFTRLAAKQQQDNQRQYQTVYIYQGPDLFVCDLVHQQVKCVSLTMEVISLIRESISQEMPH